MNLSAIRLPPPLFPPLLSHHVKKSSIRPLGKGKEEKASPLSSPALLTHEKEEESSKEEGEIGGGSEEGEEARRVPFLGTSLHPAEGFLWYPQIDTPSVQEIWRIVGCTSNVFCIFFTTI